MTSLLALDLGTKTGYALHGGGPVVSGVQSFANDRYSGGGMRYLKFERWLKEMHATRPIGEVIYEEVRNHGKAGIDAAHVYGGLMAVLTAWCEAMKIPYEGVPVGAIKKFATGKGNANKEAVMSAVLAWGFTPIDDNEADALALLAWRVEQMESAAA